MGETNDDLSARLKAAAEQRVGGKALTSKFGIDCFGLVDVLLRSLGAQTAADGSVTVTKTADYDWGDGILLDSIQPGDILQFSNHVVDIGTWKHVNGKWHETDGRELTRPHHTAIVIAVSPDGVTVVEQNVQPNPNRITRSVIPKLDAGEVERPVRAGVKIRIKVTGSVKAYRAVPKAPAGASLWHGTGGWRGYASIVPAHGGARRSPGTIGTDRPA